MILPMEIKNGLELKSDQLHCFGNNVLAAEIQSVSIALYKTSGFNIRRTFNRFVCELY